MRYKVMVLFSLGFTFLLPLKAEELKNKSPKTYIVKEGDTLWELAANLLDDPLLWPKLWINIEQKIQSTQNPNLIYPGDLLSLIWIKGEPTLIYKRKIKRSTNLTSPLKSQKSPAPINTTPFMSLNSFISKDLILNTKQIETTPRLVNIKSTKTRFITDDIFYTEGLFDENKTYGIYRLGSAFEDITTGEPLGTELLFIGYSKVSKETNNTSLSLEDKVTAHHFIKSVKEARAGDLILPITEGETLPHKIVPKLVSNEIKGYILSIQHNLTEAAQWNTVLINKGTRDNIKLGSLFLVLQSKPNRLTDNIIGELMVINSNEKVSVAIVLHAKSAIRVEDKIQGRLKKH